MLPSGITGNNLWPSDVDLGAFDWNESARPTKPVKDLPRWLGEEFPDWTWSWPHTVRVIQALADVTAGKCKRLMICMPPRHGKSELVTIRYVAWRILKDPSLRVILGAHNQDLADKFSVAGREIVRKAISGRLAKDTEKEWRTGDGGGVYATGVGGSVTGRGAHLIVIDDPVKSREEAYSEAYRERVAGWYKTDLWTRQEPECAIILIMTRWHLDDLGGRILGSAEGPSWRIVRLPGLAETQEARDSYFKEIKRPDLMGSPDPTGRPPGEPLCPERYDAEFYDRARGVMGRDFHAVVQQRPTAPEGAMFHRDWFEIVDGIPGADEKPHVDEWGQLYEPPVYPAVRYWDKAGSVTAQAAFTAGVLLIAGPSNIVYVADLVMGKWESARRERMIDDVAEADGPLVTIIVEQEPGSGGKESAENTVRRLAIKGYTAWADRPSGDKVLRAEPMASLAAGGGVKLVRGAWNQRYLDILASFPHGIKDPVDATSGGLKYLEVTGEVQATENPFYQ